MRSESGIDVARKAVFSILILLLAVAGAYSSSIESGVADTLDIYAIVPDDYGVVIPDSVLILDRFAFEVDADVSSDTHTDEKGRELLSSSEVSIGEITGNEEDFMFTLLYYGNLSASYDVSIAAMAGLGWRLNPESQELCTIPISVIMSEADGINDDISVVPRGFDAVDVHIPPHGPRRGVPVVKVVLLWNAGADLIPGRYHAEINIELRAI